MRRGRFQLSLLTALAVSSVAIGPAIAAADDDDDDAASPPAAAAPASTAVPVAQTAPAAAGAVAPAAGPAAPPALPPPPAVSPRVTQLDTGADRLHDSYDLHTRQMATVHTNRAAQATEYYRSTGMISQSLATGAAPGDPNLVAQLEKARQALADLQGNTAQLNTISTGLTDDAASALYLSQQVRDELDAPGKPAVDRTALAGVEAKVSAVQSSIDQTLRDVLAEVARQNRSLAIEHQNLDVFSREIDSGALEPAAGPITARQAADMARVTAADEPRSGKRPTAGDDGLAGKPLVVIPRDSAGQSYEHQLYAAVAEILARSPNAKFTVRAATPSQTSGARWALEASDVQHKANDVMRSLATFGLPRSRITLTQGSDGSLSEPEVQVFAQAGPRGR